MCVCVYFIGIMCTVLWYNMCIVLWYNMHSPIGILCSPVYISMSPMVIIHNPVVSCICNPNKTLYKGLLSPKVYLKVIVLMMS